MTTSLAAYEPHPLAHSVQVGMTIEFPLHRFRVVATDFKRHGAFPDAVAQVEAESGVPDFTKPGTHIQTPFGMVQVVKPRTAGFGVALPMLDGHPPAKHPWLTPDVVRVEQAISEAQADSEAVFLDTWED